MGTTFKQLALLLTLYSVAGVSGGRLLQGSDSLATFEASQKGYEALVAAKPYGESLQVENAWVCYYHYFKVVAKNCKDGDDALCCSSIESMLQQDQGNCLCERMIIGDAAVVGNVLTQLGSRKCQIDFPIPQVEPEQLPLAVRKLEECQGKEFTELRSDFIGMTDDKLIATDADDLPTFRDVFIPPPGGKFATSYTNVNVSRPSSSIIENTYSTPDEFSAIVVYPANKSMEQYDAVTGVAVSPVLAESTEVFPVVSFSPGFQSPPEVQLIMMSHLASFGMVVIAQRSTSPLVSSDNDKLIGAWALDVALGLNHLKYEAENPASFLHERLDISRAAVGGHSFGAIAAFPAAMKAAEFGVTIKAIFQLQPTCVPIGNVCDAAADANLWKLKSVKYLILAGRLDTTASAAHARFFANLPALNTSDVSLVLLEGVTHCIAEIDPKFWPFVGDCGSGYLSPMEQASRVQKATSTFLVDAFQLS